MYRVLRDAPPSMQAIACCRVATRSITSPPSSIHNTSQEDGDATQIAPASLRHMPSGRAPAADAVHLGRVDSSQSDNKTKARTPPPRLSATTIVAPSGVI